MRWLQCAGPALQRARAHLDAGHCLVVVCRRPSVLKDKAAAEVEEAGSDGTGRERESDRAPPENTPQEDELSPPPMLPAPQALLQSGDSTIVLGRRGELSNRVAEEPEPADAKPKRAARSPLRARSAKRQSIAASSPTQGAHGHRRTAPLPGPTAASPTGTMGTPHQKVHAGARRDMLNPLLARAQCAPSAASTAVVDEPPPEGTAPTPEGMSRIVPWESAVSSVADLIASPAAAGDESSMSPALLLDLRAQDDEGTGHLMELTHANLLLKNDGTVGSPRRSDADHVDEEQAVLASSMASWWDSHAPDLDLDPVPPVPTEPLLHDDLIDE